MSNIQAPLKVAIFYDGNYFIEVSRYYRYQHMRHSWISLEGLHAYVCEHLAGLFPSPLQNKIRIREAHFFRGRYYAKDCDDVQLRRDRTFDDNLTQQGIIPHFSPIALRHSGEPHQQERNIDVRLALEAYELMCLKQFDAIVLIASSRDYVPLVCKLQFLGAHVVLLAWEFEYSYMQDTHRHNKQTRVSQRLIEVTDDCLLMHQAMDTDRGEDPLVDTLFVDPVKDTHHDQQDTPQRGAQANEEEEAGEEGDIVIGEVLSVHEGFAFIEKPPNNIFFHYNEFDGDFADLRPGDRVSYTPTIGDKGQNIALGVRLLQDRDVAQAG